MQIIYTKQAVYFHRGKITTVALLLSLSYPSSKPKSSRKSLIFFCSPIALCQSLLCKPQYRHYEEIKLSNQKTFVSEKQSLQTRAEVRLIFLRFDWQNNTNQVWINGRVWEGPGLLVCLVLNLLSKTSESGNWVSKDQVCLFVMNRTTWGTQVWNFMNNSAVVVLVSGQGVKNEGPRF